MCWESSRHSPSEYIGQIINSAAMTENELRLGLSGGRTIGISDLGDLCSEARYMRTDDDVASLVGRTLLRIEVKDAPNEPDELNDHEVCFLEIGTDAGFVTISNHNEHNGYYEGFEMEIYEIDE